MKKFSVIVPVYNTEQYLDQCLGSLLLQSHKDYEIIIVNDGSTDRSSDIIEKYVSEYPDKIRTISQVNSGLSAARNTGISQASGEYLCFVDSDDWVAPDFIAGFESALRPFSEEKRCVVVCDRDFVTGDNVTRDNISDFPPSGIEDRPELVSKLNLSACNKAYHRDLFIDNLFPIGRLYEDVVPVLKATLSADLIIKTNRVLYHVRKDNPNSITSNINERESDLPLNLEEIRGYIEDHYPSVYPHFMVAYSNSLIYFVTRVVGAGRSDFLKYVRIDLIELRLLKGLLPKLALVLCRLRLYSLLRFLLVTRKRLI